MISLHLRWLMMLLKPMKSRKLSFAVLAQSFILNISSSDEKQIKLEKVKDLILLFMLIIFLLGHTKCKQISTASRFFTC